MRSGTNEIGCGLAILLDTQAIVWLRMGDPRLSPVAADVIAAGDVPIFISAVTAYEFSELDKRNRFGLPLMLETVVEALGAVVTDFPAECWKIAVSLPPLHRDPVDRMLIAHAIHADLAIVTADTTMRAYPVRTIW